MTTHVALTARALGAKEMLVDGRDPELEATVASVVQRFGGDFTIQTGVAWRKVMKGWRGTIVHLTMYGQPLGELLPKLPSDDELLVVVGGKKVPGELYRLAHHNVAVGNQPHSEVAALAIFLDRLTGGAGLRTSPDGRVRVIPSPSGKLLLRRGAVPRPGEAVAIHEAMGTPTTVRAHCEGVAAWAVTLAEAAGADVALTRAGALLHDIGRCRTRGWQHGPEGARILQDLGVAEPVARIAETHMGAGLTAHEAAARGLPARDLLPKGLEAKIVCIADRMTQGTRGVTVQEATARVEAMGLPPQRFLTLVGEVEGRIGRPLDDLRRPSARPRRRGARAAPP